MSWCKRLDDAALMILAGATDLSIMKLDLAGTGVGTLGVRYDVGNIFTLVYALCIIACTKTSAVGQKLYRINLYEDRKYFLWPLPLVLCIWRAW